VEQLRRSLQGGKEEPTAFLRAMFVVRAAFIYNGSNNERESPIKYLKNEL